MAVFFQQHNQLKTRTIVKIVDWIILKWKSSKSYNNGYTNPKLTTDQFLRIYNTQITETDTKLTQIQDLKWKNPKVSDSQRMGEPQKDMPIWCSQTTLTPTIHQPQGR